MEREIQSFREYELEFAGIPQFGGVATDIVSPQLSHSDTCSPELSPLGANGILVPPVCVVSSGPTDIYRRNRAFTNACLCSMRTGGFLSATSQQGIVLYRDQLVALGSRATLLEQYTTDKSASDPPAFPGSSVVAL